MTHIIILIALATIIRLPKTATGFSDGRFSVFISTDCAAGLSLFCCVKNLAATFAFAGCAFCEHTPMWRCDIFYGETAIPVQPVLGADIQAKPTARAEHIMMREHGVPLFFNDGNGLPGAELFAAAAKAAVGVRQRLQRNLLRWIALWRVLVKLMQEQRLRLGLFKNERPLGVHCLAKSVEIAAQRLARVFFSGLAHMAELIFHIGAPCVEIAKMRLEIRFHFIAFADHAQLFCVGSQAVALHEHLLALWEPVEVAVCAGCLIGKEHDFAETFNEDRKLQPGELLQTVGSKHRHIGKIMPAAANDEQTILGHFQRCREIHFEHAVRTGLYTASTAIAGVHAHNAAVDADAAIWAKLYAFRTRRPRRKRADTALGVHVHWRCHGDEIGKLHTSSFLSLEWYGRAH